jgi:signal transduction histidine kinase
MADLRIVSQEVRFEQDVVTARRRAREIAGMLGFDSHDQTRIGTAVSEIVRNAFRYAGGGTVTFDLVDDIPQRLSITISDRGTGIPDLDHVLSGRYVSRTGMGMGLIGARRLMDDFELVTGPAGTKVTMGKRLLPAHHIGGRDVAAIGEALQKASGGGPLEEIQLQNHELIRAIGEIQNRQAEIERLNDELGETNRGVLALNAELEDRADSLRVASQAKSRFLSHISHEFRTPLNSIRNLARMLATHMDGPLTPEQERQVFYIRSSADALLEMVNDLLDLAKIEAGKTEIQLSEINLAEMLGAMRGMFRPLMTSDQVTLSFADATALPSMRTDETKLSQIVRNLISNAVKYTERGRIDVAASLAPGDRVRIAVSDTGIGIATENLPRIFDEFVQVTNPLQMRHKGTGLGLSLSMSLARMLGGTIDVESELGFGSTFTVILPRQLAADSAPALETTAPLFGSSAPSSPSTVQVLIADDSEADRYTLRALLPRDCEVMEATNGREALASITASGPSLLFLDLNMPEVSGREVLARLREHPPRRPLKIVVHTSEVLTDPQKADLRTLGASAFLAKGYRDLDLARAEIAGLVADGASSV